jgi:hypothetical protein
MPHPQPRSPKTAPLFIIPRRRASNQREKRVFRSKLALDFKVEVKLAQVFAVATAITILEIL